MLTGSGSNLLLDKTGIWRVPVDGGEEVEVFAGPLVHCSQWDLVSAGIYYVTYGERTDTIEMRIHYLDLSSGESVETFREEGPHWKGSVAVSPDEEVVHFSKKPLEESALMLVENFR